MGPAKYFLVFLNSFNWGKVLSFYQEKKISNENTLGESIMEETAQVNDEILRQEMRGGGEDKSLLETQSHQGVYD